MKTNVHKTAQLGDLVVAAFDQAEHYSTDPWEVSCLATQAVLRMLRRAHRPSTPPSPPTTAKVHEWEAILR
jgi:hypothetical protein